MSFLKNRLRTIVGEDAGFFQALSRLVYYSLNKKRITKGAKKVLMLFKTEKHNWIIKQQIDVEDTKQQITRFVINPQITIVLFGSNKSEIAQTIKSIDEQLYSPAKVILEDTEMATQLGLPGLIEHIDIDPYGEYVLMLDAGSDLTKDCLFEVAKAINENASGELKLVYFSEEEIEGSHSNLIIKQGWSPHLIHEQNYIKHAVLHKTLIGEYVFGGNNAVEYTYKAIKATANELQRWEVISLRRVLLSSQKQAESKIKIENNFSLHISGNPLVSIIIPTRNKYALVKQSIQSVIERSTYKNFEIILLDNRSDEQELLDYIEELKGQKDVMFKCIYADMDFNFSSLINLGVDNSRGEYILLLNNDVKIITHNWIELMLGYAQQKQTGAVGAKLLYPNNTIQHAGIVLEEENICKHVFIGKQPKEKVYQDALNTTRNYLALTAACLMISKEKFEKLKGFDVDFKIEFNDIDFCLRVYEQGYYNIFAHKVELYHYESASRRHPHSDKRSYRQHLVETALMRQKWNALIKHDPYNIFDN